MAGKPLGQEEVPRGTVDGVCGGVTKGVKRVALIESGLLLPGCEQLLRSTLREPPPRHRNEQGCIRVQGLTAPSLPDDVLP